MSGIELFHVSEIDIVFEPHDWVWARDNAAAIEAHWRDVTATNKALFDGRVLLLHRFELKDGRFSGACFETAFSAFNAWRKFGFPDLSVRNFFSMAALRGADGAFLLGEMGPQTASAGQAYFPAGTPDLTDIRDGRADLLGSVVRELEEETGLGPSDADMRPGWDVVFCGGFLAFMRQARVRESGAAAARRIDAWLARQDRPELSRIHVAASAEAAASLKMPPFMLPYLRWAFAQPPG